MARNSYTTRSGKTSGKKKYLLLGLIILLIAGGVVGALEKTNKINLFGSEKSAEKTTNGPDNINFNPPTKEEQKAADDQKEKIAKNQDSQPSSSTQNPSSGTSKHSVKPIIVSAGAGDVRGSIFGVTENGGTCTATFTNGTQTVTGTSAAFADAQNTVCPPISYTSPVGSGWKVTLSYQSTVSEGVSDATTIQ